MLACRYTLWERTSLQFEHDSEKIEVHLKERLWQEASLDPLTGLYNRSHFETRFNEEFERARRTGEQFIVLFLDVDDFRLQGGERQPQAQHGGRRPEAGRRDPAVLLQTPPTSQRSQVREIDTTRRRPRGQV
jgi:hypothetical protein